MTDPFVLTIIYKGAASQYTAQLMLRGYTHAFKVLINETEVYFEPDEEGSYRAIQMPGQDAAAVAAIDIHILELVQQQITSLLS